MTAAPLTQLSGVRRARSSSSTWSATSRASELAGERLDGGAATWSSGRAVRTDRGRGPYFDTPYGALERHGFGARLRRRGHTVTLTVKSGRAHGRGACPMARLPSRRAAPAHRAGGARAMPTRPGWLANPARPRTGRRGARRGAAADAVHHPPAARDAHVLAARRHRPAGHARRGRGLVGPHGRGHLLGAGGRDPDGREALLRRRWRAARGTASSSPERALQGGHRARPGRHERHAARPTHLPQGAQVARRQAPTTRSPRPAARCCGMHLARMLVLRGGTRTGEDIEELHKMRVATRRMRAAWRVFDGAYRRKVQRRYVRELRAVGAPRWARCVTWTCCSRGSTRTCGALPERRPRGDGAAARRLGAPARGAPQDAHPSCSTRATTSDFVEDYLDFTETPGAGELRPAGAPVLVRDTAGRRIWMAYERVRAHETVLGWADVPALHALRIDGKRLRYTLESFREVLPPRAWTPHREGRRAPGPPGPAQRCGRGSDHGTGIPDVQWRPVGSRHARCRERLPGLTRADRGCHAAQPACCLAADRGTADPPRHRRPHRRHLRATVRPAPWPDPCRRQSSEQRPSREQQLT